MSKLYESMLEKKLRIEIEDGKNEAQSDFRKGRSLQHHIFTITQVLEKTRISKRNVYLAFLAKRNTEQLKKKKHYSTVSKCNKRSTTKIKAMLEKIVCVQNCLK